MLLLLLPLSLLPFLVLLLLPPVLRPLLLPLEGAPPFGGIGGPLPAPVAAPVVAVVADVAGCGSDHPHTPFPVSTVPQVRPCLSHPTQGQVKGLAPVGGGGGGDTVLVGAGDGVSKLAALELAEPHPPNPGADARLPPIQACHHFWCSLKAVLQESPLLA